MPEHDQKERVLGGNTGEAGDQAALAKVRANLLEHVRVTKGLPPKPVNLDVEILSGISNSPVIDNPEVRQKPQVIPIDTATLPATDSIVGSLVHQGRLEQIKHKKAA